MTRFSRTLLALVCLALVFSTGTAGVSTGIAGVSPAFSAPHGQQGSTASVPTHRLQTSTTQANTRVQTIQFESKLVGKTLPYNVLLPVDYDQPAAKSKRYPVLYLLHG